MIYNLRFRLEFLQFSQIQFQQQAFTYIFISTLKFNTMKNLILTLSCLFIFLSVQAQKSWEAPLNAQITKAQQSEKLEDLFAAVAIMERIAYSEKEEWIPAYYAAYYNLTAFWRAGKDNVCNTCMEKTDEMLTIAEAVANNDEVITMRAYYYQSQLAVSPMKGPILGPKTTTLLYKAIEMNNKNPRAQYLLAQNLYYTPEMFGGGMEKARPHLEAAKELFAAQEEVKGLTPSWGKRDLARFVAETEKSKE